MAQEAQQIVIAQIWVVALVVLLFAYIGARRGVNRELIVLATAVVAVVLVNGLGAAAQPLFVRFYRMIAFIVRGGLIADNPPDVWVQVANAPTPLDGARGQEIVEALLFILLLALSYGAGGWWGQRKGWGVSRLDRAMGFVVGGVTGYLVLLFVFPRLIAQRVISFAVPAGEISGMLQTRVNVGQVLAIALFIVFIFGIRASR